MPARRALPPTPPHATALNAHAKKPKRKPSAITSRAGAPLGAAPGATKAPYLSASDAKAGRSSVCVVS